MRAFVVSYYIRQGETLTLVHSYYFRFVRSREPRTSTDQTKSIRLCRLGERRGRRVTYPIQSLLWGISTSTVSLLQETLEWKFRFRNRLYDLSGGRAWWPRWIEGSGRWSWLCSKFLWRGSSGCDGVRTDSLDRCVLWERRGWGPNLWRHPSSRCKMSSKWKHISCTTHAVSP